MAYTDDDLARIYNRTSGYCRLCGKKLSLLNYARPGRRGTWEVEHSRPQALGGSDHLNNLFPSCIQCNRDKGVAGTRTVRAWNGRKRAPLSREKRLAAKQGNAVAGGLMGGIIGLIAGPVVAAVGALIGAGLGYKVNPDAEQGQA